MEEYEKTYKDDEDPVIGRLTNEIQMEGRKLESKRPNAHGGVDGDEDAAVVIVATGDGAWDTVESHECFEGVYGTESGNGASETIDLGKDVADDQGVVGMVAVGRGADGGVDNPGLAEMELTTETLQPIKEASVCS